MKISLKSMALALSILFVWLSSCTSPSLTSTQSPQGAVIAGQLYYLPKGMIHIAGKNNQKTKTYSLTVSVQHTADRDHSYVLSANSNIFTNDDDSISVNKSGLLKTVNSSPEDSTGAIIQSLTEIFVLASGGGGPESLVEPSNAPLDFAVIFDSTSSKDINRAIALMKNARVSVLSISNAFRSSNTSIPKNVAAKGVALRYGSPFSLTVKWLNEVKHFDLIVPDPTKTYVFDMARAPFVKKTTKLTFTDGMLTSSTITKPSEVVGFLSIPKNILSALIPLPGQISSNKLDALKNEIDLQKLKAGPSEVDLLKSKVELLKLQQELEALNNSN